MQNKSSIQLKDVVMTIKYCPKCHKEAYRLIEEGDNIKVIQGGRTVLNLNKNSSVSMSFACPSGHPVKMELNPKVEEKV